MKNNWSKKATLLLAAICVALSVINSAVVKPKAAWLLQVDGVPIYRELYTYYLSEALRNPAYSDAAKDEKQRKALREDVARRCMAFIAVNSELHNMWQVLEQQYKAQVAERAGFLWRTFGDYYSAIGVGKETITQVATYKANQKQLFFSIYDAGSRKVPEQQIKDYFYRTHAAYEGLRVFRTALDATEDGGGERPMTAAESEALRKKLVALAEEINKGKDFFTACEEHAADLSYAAPSTAELRRGDADFTEAEFEKVRQLDPSKVTVLEFPGFFLLARGVNMGEGDNPREYYDPQRGECLWEMKQAEYAVLLEELTASYRADENEAAVEDLLDAWKW
ncbi:MAG: hypothetical protein LBS96_05905 [Oscillospiraceae bacterium]|jgi:hypothetical protein|nr:hypothetical protein [Oscillospiraceae bacterium]